MIDDEGKLYTFATSSRGGLGAIAQLARRYAQHRKRHPDVFPKITLRVGSYQHSNREFGRIKFPDFGPAGYVPKVGFYAALGRVRRGRWGDVTDCIGCEERQRAAEAARARVGIR
jgi:hypothetical protein